MKQKNFVLDFTIPQGPTGPIGPSNGLNAYGGIYSNCLNVLYLGIDNSVILPLNDKMLENHMNYTTENSITIEQNGTYQISFVVDVATSKKANITVSVWDNENLVLATEKTKSLAINEKTVFSGNTICNLQKDSIIRITIASDVETEVAIDENASLVIKKID